MRGPCCCGGGCTSNVTCSLIGLPMCFPTEGHMPIRLTPGSFISQNCLYFCCCCCSSFKSDSWYLVSDVSSCDVSASTSQATLRNCQHLVIEDSWWGGGGGAASLPLQEAALLPHSLSACSHHEGPFQPCDSGICQHFSELDYVVLSLTWE